MFSGSYDPEDVLFLLKRVELAPTPLEEKERLIQSGQRHYSEMISEERLPSPDYLRLFHQAMEEQKARFAADLLALGVLVARARSGDITLVSLARAGTPVGVLLTRILRRFGRRVVHYSISIIRDRGIDANALRHILARHEAESVVFVDGWTGKGVIARELEQSIGRFNATTGLRLDPGLFVVADLCGVAACAATDEDYLIPSCILGCTVSGLISRSILNDAVTGPEDFHGCIFHEQFAAQDLSRWFVEVLWREEQPRLEGGNLPDVTGVTEVRKTLRRNENAVFLQSMGQRFSIHQVHHIKPGIGEATRVLLRRVPDRVLLREAGASEVAHLRVLAEEKKVPIVIEPTLPYRAAALIKEVDR